MKLLKVGRELEKDGLHRMLATQVIVRIDSAEELKNCSLMFREKISKDTYIYMEELTKLTNFKLHPKQTIDIEKPASVSKDHQIVWSLPLSMMIAGNEWIQNVQFLEITGSDKNSLDLVARENQVFDGT